MSKSEAFVKTISQDNRMHGVCKLRFSNGGMSNVFLTYQLTQLGEGVIPMHQWNCIDRLIRPRCQFFLKNVRQIREITLQRILARSNHWRSKYRFIHTTIAINRERQGRITSSQSTDFS